MVLIFTSNEDQSALEVKKWLMTFNEKVLLITPNILAKESTFYAELGNDYFRLDGEKIEVKNIKSVWYRKWPINKEISLLSKKKTSENNKIETWLKGELEQLSMFLFNYFEKYKWLCFPDSTRTNKLIQQKIALKIGLDCPKTFLTTVWKSKKKEYITKSIENNIMINFQNCLYTNYTENIIHFEDVFPSLVQEKIEKEYEVRVFYLNEKCYPMAIFSQSDEQTKTDFRRYNLNKPNRTVPYQLDDSIKEKIEELMQKLDLNTGSLDFIRCKKSNKLYFLEVNPQGQFGMVSKPCNYHLEKKIAVELVNMNHGTY